MMKQRYMLFLFILLTGAITGCKKEDPLPVREEDKQKPVSDREILPHDFLSGEKFDQLVVEVQYAKGFKPSSATLEKLESFLQQRLHKPAGISILEKEIASPAKSSYSLNEIVAIEQEHRTQTTQGNQLTAYFFFADGDYAGNSGSSKVLGIAYGSTSMVIFEKTIQEYSGGISQPAVSTLETTVVQHEFAHILGLVNNGTAMQENHQDDAHGRHCTNKNCLMYYTAETSDIIANIIGGNIPQLDAACIADLQANGGK